MLASIRLIFHHIWLSSCWEQLLPDVLPPLSSSEQAPVSWAMLSPLASALCRRSPGVPSSDLIFTCKLSNCWPSPRPCPPLSVLRPIFHPTPVHSASLWLFINKSKLLGLSTSWSYSHTDGTGWLVFACLCMLLLSDSLLLCFLPLVFAWETDESRLRCNSRAVHWSTSWAHTVTENWNLLLMNSKINTDNVFLEHLSYYGYRSVDQMLFVEHFSCKWPHSVLQKTRYFKDPWNWRQWWFVHNNMN